LGGNERGVMRIIDQLERHGRRWTLNADGCHVQFGDLLDEVTDAVRNDYDLFSLETILEAVDSVAVAPNGNDRKNISVSRLRTALKEAGIE
jgi:DNA polymerase sigma